MAMRIGTKLAAYADKLLYDIMQQSPFITQVNHLKHSNRYSAKMDITMYSIIRHYHTESAVLRRHELENFEDSHEYIITYINCAAKDVYGTPKFFTTPLSTCISDDDDKGLFCRLNMLLFLVITHKVLRESCIADFLASGKRSCNNFMIANAYYDFYSPIDIKVQNELPFSAVSGSSGGGSDEVSRVLVAYNRINKKIKRIRTEEESRLRLIHRIAKELKLLDEISPGLGGGALNMNNVLLCASGSDDNADLSRQLKSYNDLIAGITGRAAEEVRFAKNYSKFLASNSELLDAAGAASGGGAASTVAGAMDTEFLRLSLLLEERVCSYFGDNNSLSMKEVRELCASILPTSSAVAINAIGSSSASSYGVLRVFYDIKAGNSLGHAGTASPSSQQLELLRAQHAGVLDRAAMLADNYCPYRLLRKNQPKI